ncbi:hypothetical protein LOAG_15912 [Loa loa]|uniref:Tyrosine-protein phosphatase domain-containing protein n=1 Tax=Loa loa TaxID=7209 RepID=A0A1S0TEL6_LOALO|nr:hypothetical protein LOAG_15912 [Loa loa]EFO12621.1 hypothetical protein LOAG_15912 [Loa loa]
MEDIIKQLTITNQVERWVRRALDKGVGGLREEFLTLKRYTPEGMTTHAFQGTFEAGKSRYKDVPCQDKYRVILRWPGVTEDYIHANYVATPINEKRFICTQVSDHLIIFVMPIIIENISKFSNIKFIKS